MGKIVTGAQFRKMVISGANYLESNKEYVDSAPYPIVRRPDREGEC